MARWSRCPAYADHVAHERGGRGPFAGGTVYQTHEECDRLLRGHCAEWESGEVVRKNELGFLVLDDGIFPAPHWSLSLAHPVDVHRVQRRFARELIGRIPGRGTLLQEVSRFMHGRTSIEFPRDVDVWWSRMLWTYVAGHDVDEAFAHGFIKMRDSWLLGSAGHVGQISVLDLKFTNDGVLRGQVKYRDMIAQKLPFEVQEEHRALVAQGILEMFCFAGGLSVPSTIRSAVACIYTGIMTEAITLHNVEAFVYEVTRLFPAVQGFPWHKDGHRHIAHLAAALRDPKAWGPDSDKFTLKDLNTYREKHIGFAKSARSATDDNNSRFCPGAQQALDACQAFVLVLSSPSSCHKLVAEPAWRSAERIQPATKPDYFKSFALERDGVNLRENLSLYQSFVDGSQTGEQAFADCTPEDFESFIKTVDSDGDGVPDALSAMDEFTKFFYRASTLAWEDNYHITEVEVPRRPAAPLTSHNSVVLPVGGVRMPTEDEQWSGTPVWKILAQRAFRVLASRSSDSMSEQLLVRDDESRRRAVCLARLAFAREREGSHLPPAKDVWREFSSDPAQGLLALYGWGQLDLQRNKEPAREGLGEFVVDPLSRLFGSILGLAILRHTCAGHRAVRTPRGLRILRPRRLGRAAHHGDPLVSRWLRREARGLRMGAREVRVEIVPRGTVADFGREGDRS
ncbi:unnamed protein product [Prorocentrum cordatum]|uniref:EF-hand domain-containing protein n=1 Tax=Prorocentrum cordatum TaxID=2364126 RepID=A0ABN9WZX7_9DINO|nr:unnamed protein product [Polarella glacialis]